MIRKEDPRGTRTDKRDRRTLRLLADGDAKGLRRLLRDHGATVRARLQLDFGKAFDTSTLDEVMSLTIIRAWTHRRRIDPSLGSLRAWITVVARHCALRMLRSRQRLGLRFLDELEQDEPAAADASQHELDRDHLLADLYACIFLLPDQQRAVILADIDADNETSATQIAAQLQIPLGSVYRARSEARQTLLENLRRRGHDISRRIKRAGIDRTSEPRADHA